MTLREVGENLGLTRERVRQLENQALQKLIGALRETSAAVAAERGRPEAEGRRSARRARARILRARKGRSFRTGS